MNVQEHLPDLNNYAELSQYLQKLGAEELGHINGNLMAHLEGTYQYLKDWGNRQELCVAGLYHAVYSTHGYPRSLVRPDQREIISQMIGAEAENIVHHFAACDRQDFYPRIGRDKSVMFLNRFLNTTEILEPQLFRDLLELTMANELEIAQHSESAKMAVREQFTDLFNRFEPYVSQNAFRSYQQLFANL